MIQEIIIPILLLTIFWLIANTIVKILLTRSQDDSKGFEVQLAITNFVSASLAYRKTIMFDILALLVLWFFNIEFLFIIAIIYYIIITILETILILKSLTTELNLPVNRIIIDELRLLLCAKIFNTLSSIVMIFTLWSFI